MIDNARNAALFALNRIEKDKSWTAALINNVSKQYGLDERDTAFFSRLVLSTVENKRLLDYYIDYYSDNISKLDISVRSILRLSICQIIFFDRVPNHAAVDSAVELCKINKSRNASGYVNAVLRKVTSNVSSLPEIPSNSSSEFLSIKYSHPNWLSEYLISKYGEEFTESFYKANNSSVPLFVHTNTLKISTDELFSLITENSDLSVLRHEYVNDILIISNSGDVTKIPGFNEGLFYVQDPAAAQTVFVAGIEPGMKVFDACSAPGGKSISASLLMKNEGSILSCDIHEKKLNLINESAERLGINIINTKVHDARELCEDEFDVVITDVPCSGMGVIRKKPEIREKSNSEIVKLPQIQYDIIDMCSKSVKLNGILLYTTCTIIEEENREVIDRFLMNHNNFELCDFEINDKLTGGYYTFWPQNDNTDGFFVCKMRRIK